jgi:hypothetical protein
MSRSVHHADNLCVGAIDTVEHKVVAHDQRPGVWRNLRPCLAKSRLVGQALASGDDPINEAVCGGRIVQRDMKPDIIKVKAGARR